MARAQKFGTFGGVFVPSVLTILGVIMYLRLGWVVGNAGLIGTIIIILIAHVISVTTGLSVSSIATDKKVKAGGIYYMLSRSLGLPIGGAIGIALFVATALSIAMYIVGFAESFNSVIGINVVDMDPLVRVNNLRITGTVTLIIVSTIALVSTSLAIKTQYYILGAILLSLVSIFSGGLLIDHGLTPDVRPMFPGEASQSMETIFAIFFPAVTGFTAGVAMSGDLKDPKKSIPVGTMAAIGVGLLVYISLAVFLSATVDATALKEDTNVLSKIALFSAYGAPFLMAGIWGATLSSALGGILGGPRILQAMSLDRVTPKVFGKGVGKSNEPRNALIFAFVIAEAGILIGELDLIAPIVSMFYLSAYGFINLTCALESWSGSDFRPSFSIPRSISWLGAIATFTVMFKLDMLAMFASFVVIGLIFLYLTRKQISLGFSDVWQGVWSEVVRLALSRINQSETDRRSWRPNIILFSGGTEKRPHLLEYGTKLVGKLGLLSNFDLVEDRDTKVSFVKNLPVQGSSNINGVFTRQYKCNDIYSGIERISETYGFSGLDPNTILLGWARYGKQPVRFSQLISRFQQLGFSLLIMDYDSRVGFGDRQRVDIWCEGSGRHLSFVLTISRFLNTSDDWQGAKVRLNIVADTSQADDLIIHQKLEQVQEELRINFEVKIINTALVRHSLYEVVRYESAEADLVYLELPEIKEGQEEIFFQRTDALCKEIGTVVLYKGSEEFEVIDLGITSKSLETIKSEESADLNYASLPSVRIPELNLPDNPEMASVVRNQDQETQYLVKELYQEFLIPFTNKSVQLIQSVQRHTSEFYHGLLVENQDADKKLLTVDSKEIVLLRNLLKQMEEYQVNQLKNQQQVLIAGAEHAESTIGEMIERSPEYLKTVYDREILDNGQLANFSWTERIKYAVGAKSLQYNAAYQKVIFVLLRYYFQRALANIFTQINQDSIQFGNDLRKAIRRMAAGISSFKDGSEDKPKLSVFTEESEQIKNRLFELESKTGAQANAYRDYLLTDVVTRLQQVSKEMDLLTINEYTRDHLKNRKRWAAIQSQIGDTLASWGHNQSLDFNVSQLEIKLLILQVDLYNSVDQVIKSFKTIPHKKVVQKTRRLVDTLNRILEEARKSKYLKITSSHEAAEFTELTDTIRRFVTVSKEISDLLPEKLTVPNINQPQTEQHEELDSIEISPRDVAGYLIQTNLVSHLEAQTSKFQAILSKADHTILDVIQVVSLALDRSDTGEELPQAVPKLVSTIEGEISRLNSSIEQVNQLVEDQTSQLRERFNKVFQNLNAHSIIKAAVDFDYYLMTQKQTQVINKFSRISQSLRNNILAGFTKLYYRRSEGLIAAKRFKGSGKQEFGDWNSRTASMVVGVSPNYQVMEDLPFYYKQLFLRPHSVARDLWLIRDNNLTEATEAVSFYKRVKSGGLLVLGAPLSGKTYLSEFIASQFADDKYIHSVNPPDEGSIDVKVFHREVKKGLKYYGDMDSAFDHLQSDSVLVFNNLEQWWERSEAGFSVLDSLMKMIDRYSGKVLFLVNMNSYSFQLVNRISRIEEYFFKVIRTQPFNAEELKTVILSRHRTSRLKFLLNGSHEDGFSEWKLAKLFTRYFDFSDGNVGVALQQWICNIENVLEEGKIEIRQPKQPDRDVLNGIDKDRAIILVQFILHRKLNLERLSKIMHSTAPEVERHLEILQRLDFLREKNGVYAINRYLQPLLIDAFEEDLLI